MDWHDNSTSKLLSSNTYTYGDSQWLDRLTKFNGVSITYDNIGNPLSYYNGYSYTFTWDGRELATATKGSTSISYKYGADGLRTQKTVGDTVYNYYYIDGVLVRQTWGINYMDFLYDESGSAYSFIYNGTQYYYVKNLLGDVMRIVDTSGTVVANYTYDAWGKVTNSGTIIGLYNPIRYRGYYYDTDTGFYYLQSRYYDPAIKRFINADDASLLGANGDFTSLNLYSYCGNNPVARSDDGGEFWNVVIGAVIGALIGFCTTVYADYVDDGEIFNGSISAEEYVANTIVTGTIGAVTGGIGSSTFTFTYPTFKLLSTSIGSTSVVMGTATVAVSGTSILSGAGIIGAGILLFSKPNSGRIRFSDGTNINPETGRPFKTEKEAMDYYKSIEDAKLRNRFKTYLKSKGWAKNHIKPHK